MQKTSLSAVAIAVSLAVAPSLAGASVIGFLGNFDVINDTGTTAHGFEIELQGLHSIDVTDTFGGPGRGFGTDRGFGANSVERYGAPVIAEYSAGGVFGVTVRYQGLYASGAWDYGTPVVAPGVFATPGDNCWTGGGLGYGPSTPCDHFGVGTAVTPTKTTYRWLVESATPGQLSNGVVNLPAVVGMVAPPIANPGAPPVALAVVQAPAPPVEGKFGEAIWVKVFTTEFEAPPKLEDLVGNNPKIKAAREGLPEIEWQLLQTDPGNPLAGQLEQGYGAPVGPDAPLIARRYEFYDFSGTYDAQSHEAKFDAGFGDSRPGPNDVGNYLGAQNGAFANLNVAAVPEPETYALLLAGSGLVFGITRRRRQRPT